MRCACEGLAGEIYEIARPRRAIDRKLNVKSVVVTLYCLQGLIPLSLAEIEARLRPERIVSMRSLELGTLVNTCPLPRNASSFKVGEAQLTVMGDIIGSGLE